MTREDINDIINAICPNDEDYEKPCISPKYLRQELEQLALDQRQWNEEPTTKNDLVTIHTEGLDEGIRCAMCTNSMKSDRGCDGSCVVDKDMYKKVMDVIESNIVVEPTTKNDLGVDAVSRQEVLDLIADYDLSMGQVVSGIHALPSVTPQLSSELEKNSKKLEKDFGELDCISREQAKAAIRDRFKDLPSRIEINAILNELPSVTPQEPRKGKWVHREDMDYLDKNNATHNHFMCSKCGLIHDFIDGHTSQYSYCPNCGARMVAPQESEDKE